MNLYKIKFILIILITIYSCESLRHEQKRFHVTNASHPSDTLYVSNYALCSAMRGDIYGRERNQIGTVNLDSILNVFYQSLESINTPINIDKNGQNLCYSYLHDNPMLKVERINLEFIKKTVDKKDKPVLFPIIYYDLRFQINATIGAAGIVSGDDDYFIRSDLRFMAIVFYNDEIIYLKSASKVGQVERHAELVEPKKSTTREDWDDLVKLVMDDYINRLE